ncbi:MAG: aldo/keto reductase [Streptosporangiales bacterium]|nr:aldo/keto reductase [Streptosporangiales bacterium]
MMFGGVTDEKVARLMLDAFVDAGGTLVDTADLYGTSESMIAGWLRARPGARERVVLATKGRFAMEGQPGASLAPAYLRTALDASLDRLGVDHIDLYQLHGPDADTPLEDTAAFLAEAVASGNVGYVGVSNFPGWLFTKLSRLLAENGGPPLVAHQVQYSLLARAVEWEVVPATVDAGAGSLLWGPLGQGWLTGKYRRDEPPAPDTRVAGADDEHLESWHRRDTDRIWAIVDQVVKVAADLGLTPGQVAVAWAADRPGVTAPIVGARNVEQLTDSLGAADVHLPAEVSAALDEISSPPAPQYPYPWVEEISHWHD